ncbi:hypothetical protein BGX29_000700 [Mortierella sp. GBA35]|nr:hypothetical protein BGX29_000700 [Mortierella sp. GBA35]
MAAMTAVEDERSAAAALKSGLSGSNHAKDKSSSSSPSQQNQAETRAAQSHSNEAVMWLLSSRKPAHSSRDQCSFMKMASIDSTVYRQSVLRSVHVDRDLKGLEVGHSYHMVKIVKSTMTNDLQDSAQRVNDAGSSNAAQSRSS